ncbi:aminoglycoside 6-adenylyltransferase [Streptomyces acidiscabies]|uniref:aminoglycoside 6-adenylyltransferase n=1 Tax=Streptomyces acidiscabies TaxID=42234 RepID=UPI00076E9E3D|nr:aminoglycoside 6-adenylyltransferase [Streptomyces acidiscabies]GAQ57336.1 hypothetical protein a10_07206 [Streptomyces acidiscabies]
MHKDQVADRLLTLARQDPAITGAALTGSHATGHADAWSDLDLVLAVHGARSGARSSGVRGCWSRSATRTRRI